MAEDKELIGKMDPFITVRCGAQEFKTEVKKDAGKAASFSETFLLHRDSREESINFMIFDKDAFSSKLLGMASMALDQIIINPSIEQTLVLVCHKAERLQGNLVLSAKFDMK